MSEQREYKVRLPDGSVYGPATLEQIVDWARQGRIPTDAMLEPNDGSPPIPVTNEPTLAMVISAPPTISAGLQQPVDPTEGPALIPYKNPTALVGYYVGIFSCVPFIGVLLGPAAIILGIMGIRTHTRHPQRKGIAHAWIAIGCGIIGTAIGLVFVISMVFGIVGNP